MVHVQILRNKADLLTTHLFLQHFPRKTVLTASQAADGGRHRYIENSISTRCTKKVFMVVSLKLRLRHVIFGKNMKIITYLGTFSILKL